jgi:sugar lactone lactonase YvrE
MQVRRIGETVDLLGESCVWSQREQALYWIDVRGRLLRRFDYRAERTHSFPLPELAGATALRGRGGVLVAMETCIAAFDPRTASIEPLARPGAMFDNLRFNDSRCDRQGRFWAGTMDDVGRGEIGTLYRMDTDHTLVPVISPVTIPNSLAWSPDGRIMYFSDTTSRTIMSYDFEPRSGTPSNARIFASLSGPSTPDGSTVDCEGFVWNAEYDGWRITRYAPDGRVDRVVDMPVQRPTCCAFGGPELSTLFVTTAAQRLSDDERARQPLAGALLALEVGVRGLPEPEYVG